MANLKKVNGIRTQATKNEAIMTITQVRNADFATLKSTKSTPLLYKTTNGGKRLLLKSFHSVHVLDTMFFGTKACP